MSTEGLKIVIGADVSKGVAGLNDLNKALATTSTASAKTAAALGKVTPGANQAGNAITNLSRVAQDAPFGFIGIQNNLNPLLESFQRLKQETGTTSAALKSLAGSLAGPAGIGLALAAVSSLLTVAVQKYGSLGNALDALFGSTNSAAQAQRDLAKSFAEAEGKAAGEISNINAVLNVARDETLSKQARTEAINKLNQEYDKYLPKLSIENINTQAVTTAVDNLTNSLLRQAKIRGLQDLISKETAKQAELMTKSLGENASAWDNIVAAVKTLGPGGNFFTEQQLQGAKRMGENFSEAQKRIEIFNKALQELTKEEAVNGTLFVEKEKKAEDLLKKRLDALEKIKASTKDATALVGLQEAIFDLQVKIAIRDQGKNQLSKQELDQQILGFNQELQAAFNKQAIELEAIPKVKISPTVRVDIPTDIESRIAKATGLDKKIPEITLHDVRVKLLGIKLTNAIEEAERVAKLIQDTLLTGITNTLEGSAEAFGTALGEIFSGGDIGSAFAKAAQSILSLIGGVLQEVGKQIIVTSALVKALKESLKTLFANPAAGIAIGIALIAAGSILKNIKLPGFKDGGWATGPKSGYLAVLHGNELIIPENKVKQASTTGVQGSALDMPIILQPSVAIQGQALRILLNRVDATNGRLF